MSNFICSECGTTWIDVVGAGYKTPKEIELEKKLNIAIKALEEYARGDSDAGNGCLYEMPAPSLAQQALKEIDSVETALSPTEEEV